MSESIAQQCMDSFFICGYNWGMAEEPQQERNVSNEEIARLERELEEKKRALAEQGKEAAQEKEILREVVRERMGEAAPSPIPSPAPAGEPLISALKPASGSVSPLTTHDLEKERAREERLKALVEFALSHTIERAVEKAQAESPYLLDALHDRLADEYYEKMVALRKLKQL